MLFHSTIRRELARSFGATLLVLFTIVITMLLIRTLGLANKGSVDPEEIVLVLTYTVLGRLPTVLTLALFVAIVSTLSRMYRESEMVIWFSSGQGLAGFLNPILRFAWPILLVNTLMVLFVWPWTNQQTSSLRDRYEHRGDLERVAPGQFQESAGGRRVFFIDKDTADGTVGRNVFISSTDPDGHESVTSARSGHVEWIGQDQFLMLSHGQRMDTIKSGDGKNTVRVSEFNTYGVKIGSSNDDQTAVPDLSTRPTWTLIGQADAPMQGELSWRIGMAVAGLNFVVLALAVSAGNPRAGRSANLALMLFAFVFYTNFINIGQGWIALGKLSWLSYMTLLHGGVMLLATLWLAKRHFNITLWPRRRAAWDGDAT